MASGVPLGTAKRWRRRPDERPRVLMASALKLLKRDGYRRIRLEDVADAAGVCKATVYHYWKSKDDLLTRSVAARMAERHADIERRIVKAGGTAAARLRLFLREFWDVSLTAQAGLWQRLVVGEIATEAPEVFDAWGRGVVQRWRLVEQLIAEGQRNGEFRAGADAAVVARMTLTGLSYQALLQVHLGLRRFAPCDVDRLFDASIDQLLTGLRSTRRRTSRR